MTGINESMEVIGALRVLIEQGKLIMADGKLGLDDLRKMGPAYEALKKAKEGSNDIPKELAELDSEEIAELIMGVAEVAMFAYETLVGLPK